MTVYRESFSQSLLAFCILLGVIISLLILLNYSPYLARYTDADRIFLSKVIIITGILISLFLAFLLWLNRRFFIVEEKGLIIKKRFSNHLIDWQMVNSMSTVSSRYAYYNEILFGKKHVDIPVFKDSEQLIQDIVHFADLEIYQENKFLGKSYRRWKKKGQIYVLTSFRDSWMDGYYSKKRGN